jgi:hypothetical protein
VVSLGTLLILGVSAIEGTSRSVQLWRSRQELPQELQAEHPGLKTLFVLDRDPHARFIAGWLSPWQVVGISAQDMVNLIQSDRSKEYALIVGPTGAGSGNSILAHGCLWDFNFPLAEFVRLTGAGSKTLAYYAHRREFCLEEEICQGLLYAGRIPDPLRDPTKNVHLLYWPALPSR